MSLLSRASDLTQLREALVQMNSEFFLSLADRRKLCVRIQSLKEKIGSYAHYDPEREMLVFKQFQTQLIGLTLKELLAFSLVMEDQAAALAPGSYPNWSSRIHLVEKGLELFEMINPLMLKVSHPEIYQRLKLQPDFTFLKDF